ncbi:MAG: LysR family transcriptional regulator [Rhodospirillales bacterium]|nr:MAG: LysR family transcriptional regulator [Rhodospirillales bacterium]
MAVFARVVETKSFTGAAHRLGMSKAAVSKHVSKLEERLGARLLNRTTRRLSLTEVGAAFYERCARIVTEAEEAELAVSRLSAAPRGTLKIDVPVNFGMQYLAPLLPPFMLQHPELRVDMAFNDRFVDLVEEGCDLAIRIGELPDSSLMARKLAETESVICAAPSYWDRHGRPKDPGELANHDCFAYSYLATGSEWRLEGPDGAVAIRTSGSLTANNGDVLRQAAVAGIGVVAMPVFIVCDDLRVGRLEPVLQRYRFPTRGIYAVYPHNRHLSAKVRAFIDHLVDALDPAPWAGCC